MPLLTPNLSQSQIHQVLREVKGSRPEGNSTDLKQLLEGNNLSPNEVLDALASIMRGGENESVRLRAAETALKLNGMLDKNEGMQIPNVTILINNGDGGINPILIPR